MFDSWMDEFIRVEGEVVGYCFQYNDTSSVYSTSSSFLRRFKVKLVNITSNASSNEVLSSDYKDVFKFWKRPDPSNLLGRLICILHKKLTRNSVESFKDVAVFITRPLQIYKVICRNEQVYTDKKLRAFEL